jgi:hypothetical protein
VKPIRHAAKPFYAYEHDLIERWKDGNVARPSGGQGNAGKRNCQTEKDAFKSESGMAREEIRDELQAKKKALADVEAGLIAPALELRRRDFGKTGRNAGP